MTTQNVAGAAYDLDQQTIVQATTAFTLSNGIGGVDALATLTVKLSDSTHSARVGDRKRILATGGDVTVTDDNFAILGGNFVPQGTSAEYELAVAPGGTFAWVALGAGGAFGQGEIVVPNIPALALLPSGGFPDQVRARVLTLDQSWELDKLHDLAASPADGITIVAALNGGAWLRIETFSKKWSLQINWFVSEATGSDENTGASGFPVKTIAEVCRRLHQGLTGRNYHLNILDTVPLVGAINPPDTTATVAVSDRFRPSWVQSPNQEDVIPSGPFAGFQQIINMSLIGQATVVGSSSMTLGANSVGNVQASFTDAGFATAGGAVGDIVVITSGAALGATAGVGKITGAIVNVSEFLTATNAVAATPGSATYDIIRPTQFNPPVTQFGISQGRYFFSFLTFTELANTSAGVNDTFANALIIANRCVFQRSMNLGDNAVNAFNGCVFNYTGITGTGVANATTGTNNVIISSILNSAFSVAGSTFIDADVRLLKGSDQTLINSFFEGSVITTTNATPGFTNYGAFTVGANGTEGSRVVLAGTGVYNWPGGVGIHIADGSSFKATGNIRGTGTGVAVLLSGANSSLAILTGVTPTITGTVSEVRIENPNGTTDVAVRVGVSGAPPSAIAAGAVVFDAQILGSAGGTWGNWGSNGNNQFNRFAFNPNTGCRVIDCPGA